MESETQPVLYVIHGFNFQDIKKAYAEPTLYGTYSNKWTAYRHACRILLKNLVNKYGPPVPIKCQNELDDENRFNNQQVVKAYDIYKDKSIIKYMENGIEYTRNKIEWDGRFARIDAIHEKMREETKENDMTGMYYYVSSTVHHNE